MVEFKVNTVGSFKFGSRGDANGHGAVVEFVQPKSALPRDDGSDVDGWPSRRRIRIVRGEVHRVGQSFLNKNAVLLRGREADPDPQVRPGSVELSPVRGAGRRRSMHPMMLMMAYYG